MKSHKNFSFLLILSIQLLAVCLLPIPIQAQESYEGGVALINKEIPLNRYNASSPSLLSEDNPRFKAKTGYNVSDFYARNINYQNRETYFNDSLSNMNTCNISTRAGKFMSFLPQLNDTVYNGYKNFTLISEKVEYVERIQAVGKKYSYGVQSVSIFVQNSTNPYENYGIAFFDGGMIGSSGMKIAIGGNSFSDINYYNTFNGNIFDWVIDFECSRYGISIRVADYYQYFSTQTYTSRANFSRNGYPTEVFSNANFTAYKFFIDWESNHELKRYNLVSLLDLQIIGGIQSNPLGIEGIDSRLLGYSINNTLYPDNTFYPDRFDQIYPLFYEPYQNFETAILSYDQIADSDYISMSYEYIGNRWISGENGETFFPTDELSHFFIDYANIKRHVLLSGNLMYLAPVEKVEYIAPFTFRDNQVPTEFNHSVVGSYSILDAVSGHFHVLGSISGGTIGFQSIIPLNSWSVELYVFITDGQTFEINLTDVGLTEDLGVSFSDSGVFLWYNGGLEVSIATDYSDDSWHRVVISTDLFSLFDVEIDSGSILSHTIGTYLPTEFRNVSFSFSDGNIYIDAIGISNDRFYNSDDNLDWFDHTIYTATYENTIFDKRTAGVVYTWTSDHNRYNLTTTYFNYNITFQIYIDLLRITVNDTTTIIDLTPPTPVFHDSYLRRAIQYELWVYPYFDGSDYKIGVDFTFDNNRTIVYLDSWDSIDFGLASTIQTVFYMYDVDTAAVIVFTSAIKSLLKSPTSLTKQLSFVNKQYLSRKILYYRFSDGFEFDSDDMKIYIADGNLTREITTAKSIIPLNLTAQQRIIQANTTQYNSAECLTQISLFNKTAQLYSESGYNVSNILNDTTLYELPVLSFIDMGEFNGLIPLSAQWYKTLAKAINTATVIIQQASADPIGTILAIASAYSTNNYQRIIPIEEVGGDKSKISLPVLRGGSVVANIIDVVGGTLQPDNPDEKENACDKLATMMAQFTTSFFGIQLAKKIWELTQLNKAYEVCNLLDKAWDFLSGINPTTVSTVKLSITVEIHGIFSFTESLNTDNWIGFIMKFLTPFILPLIIGYVSSRFSKKLVPFGVVIGIILDGVSKIIGWDYVLIFSILGAVGSYFFITRPTIHSNDESYSDESRSKEPIEGVDSNE